MTTLQFYLEYNFVSLHPPLLDTHLTYDLNYRPEVTIVSELMHDYCSKMCIHIYSSVSQTISYQGQLNPQTLMDLLTLNSLKEIY